MLSIPVMKNGVSSSTSVNTDTKVKFPLLALSGIFTLCHARPSPRKLDSHLSLFPESKATICLLQIVLSESYSNKTSSTLYRGAFEKN